MARLELRCSHDGELDVAAQLRVPDLYGALKGRVHVPPGVDLTEPVLEDIPKRNPGEAPSETHVVLLDTCASIWLLEQQPMSAASLEAIRAATRSGRVLVSAISAREIGFLAQRPRRALSFEPSPQAWFSDLLTLRSRLAPLGHGAAIAASSLPGQSHRAPADRLLIATARDLDVPLVTRDRRILAYAAQGHLQAIAC
jgi:PIN domain nuclease of toxin-antitoxin system